MKWLLSGLILSLLLPMYVVNYLTVGLCYARLGDWIVGQIEEWGSVFGDGPWQ